MKKQILSELYRLLLYTLLLISIRTNGQKQGQLRIDSILAVLPHIPNDTNKVKTLTDLSNSYFIINPSVGVSIGERGLALAQSIGFQRGISIANNAIGNNYLTENNFPKALACYLNSLRIAEQLGSINLMGDCLHHVAIAYHTAYNYPKAIEYYEQALKIFEESGSWLRTIGLLENIAALYDNQKKYAVALEYFKKALNIADRFFYTHNIAYIFGEMGSVFAEKGDYSTALEYQRNSLKLFKLLNDTTNLAAQSGQIGITYFLQHNYNLALKYFEKTIKMFAKLNGYAAKGDLGKYYGYAGKTYASMATTGKYILPDRTLGNTQNNFLKKAEILLQKSASFSVQVNDWDDLQECFKHLSDVEVLKGKYPAALLAYKRYVSYKDSSYNSEKFKQITTYELEYEYGKQEDSISYSNELQKAHLKSVVQKEELDKLRLKQRWLYAIIAVVVFCIASLYFLFRNRIQQIHFKNERAKEIAEKQLKEVQYQRKFNALTFSSLRSQMNPHFIFNALNTIQSFVYSNDKKNANNYLGKFSDLMRKILDNSIKQNISLKEEIEVLQLYLDIEKVRFGDQLHAVIKVDPDLETEVLYIPPMIIQPYAENSIKHGLLHRIGAKELTISVNKSKDNKDVEIVIDDNGIGREKSIEINKKRRDHHSFANAANEERIKLFNQIFENKQRIEIIDKQSAEGLPSGTKVIILIPIVLSELI